MSTEQGPLRRTAGHQPPGHERPTRYDGHARPPAQPLAPQPKPEPAPNQGAAAVHIVRLPPYNTNALAGVMFSALWLFGLASVLGLIFSLVGISQSGDGSERGTAMAVVGAVWGLTGLFLGLLLILTPLTVADLVGGAPQPARVVSPYGY